MNKITLSKQRRQRVGFSIRVAKQIFIYLTSLKSYFYLQEHFAGTRNLLKEGRKQKRTKDESKYAADNPALDNNESNIVTMWATME